MDTDRNLLFGVLAMQAELINAQQFVDACALWAARKRLPLADVLIERGWISTDDQIHLDYLLERKQRKHGGNVRASLALMPEDVQCALAALLDESIQHSLAEARPVGILASAPTIDQPPPANQRYALHRHSHRRFLLLRAARIVVRAHFAPQFGYNFR